MIRFTFLMAFIESNLWSDGNYVWSQWVGSDFSRWSLTDYFRTFSSERSGEKRNFVFTCNTNLDIHPDSSVTEQLIHAQYFTAYFPNFRRNLDVRYEYQPGIPLKLSTGRKRPESGH